MLGVGSGAQRQLITSNAICSQSLQYTVPAPVKVYFFNNKFGTAKKALGFCQLW
jgi:hypothetical protein